MPGVAIAMDLDAGPALVELWSDRDALGACSFELGDLEHDLVDERVIVVVDLGPVRGVALDDHHLVARDDVVARVDKPDLVRRRHVRGEQSVVEPLARQLVHEVPLGRLRRRGRRSPVVRAVVLRTGGDADPRGARGAGERDRAEQHGSGGERAKRRGHVDLPRSGVTRRESPAPALMHISSHNVRP